MSKQHLVFIVNPKSGANRKKEIAQAVAEHLDREKYTFEIRDTEYAKHGTTLARDAAEAGAYAVVAVGGDGSVNDIIQGIHGFETKLAIIPKGSGNGMARTLGIPLDTAGAMQVINNGSITPIDLGFANDKAFISNSGVAFDALIAKKFAKSKRRGLMMYSWLITKYLWRYKCWHWDITVDGQTIREQAFVVNVANGQQYGYNFKIAPMADCTDGTLDLILVRKFPKVLGGMLAVRGLTGTIAKSPYVKHYRGRRITVTNPALNLFQTDGDAHHCENTIDYSVVPGGLKIMTP